MRVTVVGAHPLHGFSMNRYSDLLVDAYRAIGVDVVDRRPSAVLSRRVRAGGRRKVVVYLESLVIFPFQLLGDRSDVVHVANHSDALLLLLPMVSSRRAVVTCHDLLAVEAARGEIRGVRVRWSGRVYQRLVVAGLRRAGRVLAISEATAATCRRIVAHDRSRPVVSVMHNGVARDWPSESPANPTPLLVPYALVVSTRGWRKTREDAIRAWRALADVAGDSLNLVIVGPPLSQDESRIVQPLEDRVTVVEDCSEPHLQELYRGASALIQLSTFEGFGWPLIEAMAHGVPAFARDIPVFREVAPLSVFVDPAATSSAYWLDSWTRLRAVEPVALKSAFQRFTFAAFTDRLADAVVGMEHA